MLRLWGYEIVKRLVGCLRILVLPRFASSWVTHLSSIYKCWWRRLIYQDISIIYKGLLLNSKLIFYPIFIFLEPLLKIWWDTLLRPMWHINQILRDFDTEKWPKRHLFWLRFQIFGKIVTIFDHVYEALNCYSRLKSIQVHIFTLLKWNKIKKYCRILVALVCHCYIMQKNFKKERSTLSRFGQTG